MSKPKLLLGITGSVAAKLSTKLITALQEKTGCSISVALTEASKHFIDYQPLINLVGIDNIYDDAREWCFGPDRQMYRKGDQVVHVDLATTHDILVIAPCTVNTIAKLSLGICDNLLTNIYKAWSTDKPIVIAGAANTNMWQHNTTQLALARLTTQANYYLIKPIVGPLACGGVGMGALENIDYIASRVDTILINHTLARATAAEVSAGIIRT